METTEVVIAGAGPTGLMLACELRLAGIEVALIDALPQRTGESRAGGMHARTIELFEQRGLLARLEARGRYLQAGHFAGLRMDFSDFPTRHPYTLAVVQAEIEDELDRRATELGTPVRWGAPITGFRQDGEGITVEIDGAAAIRAAYLIGCDGGRSTVRGLAGIGFPGTEATMACMLADVELSDPPTDTVFSERRGMGDYSVLQFGPDWYRLIVQRHDRLLERGAKPTFETFRDCFVDIAGTDFGMHSPRWVSQFADAARQADRYRSGRVLLAGDAAHIHYPAGGQGLNMGVQDAVNLGWKLAAVLRGDTPEDLLDTYESERHPIAARVLHNTRAQTALARPGAHANALRDIVSGLLDIDEVRQRLGLMITALDIRYDMKSDHVLAGRRMPDIDLTTDGAATRVTGLLHSGRPILLSGKGNNVKQDGWSDRVGLVDADFGAGKWTIPGVGVIDAPAAVLLRPDGYVGWATDSGPAGLTDALTDWFGPAR